ncbi:MAG: hypothetical protein WCL53_08635 [Chloroflexota bacterium]
MTTPPPPNTILLRFPLEEGRSVEVRLPADWTRSDVEYVRQQLALVLRALDETVPEDTRGYGVSGYLERWCVVEPGE